MKINWLNLTILGGIAMCIFIHGIILWVKMYVVLFG